ncbi:hypothetical protein Rhopal_004403-T1 [Rhodotorula paludigena]|uniref:Muskelin N-terminal domain-containing protein n=1 Tax=Rhodotorula paludigena TaxID=86838 RepID=A0AAV5GPG0_9BASI|nr:hypothetical protein Rhopal_004403-T1 [Rhodotorula paludigena]
MEPAWDARALLNTAPLRLALSVHSVSGYHGPFHPDLVLVDRPADESSRWTSPSPESRNHSARRNPGHARRREPEWIILELQQTAIVRRIGFGKTTKPHPCNLADFTIWGGLTPDPLAMEPLLEGGLKNDAAPERFELPIEVGESLSAEGVVKGAAPLPVRYIKIDCHVAANANYSISIWHLFLEGYLPPPSPSTLSAYPLPLPSAETLTRLYESYRQTQTTHLILAHLRRSGPATLPAYTSLLSTLSPAPDDPASPSSFEHPLLTALHTALVQRGAFLECESLLARCLAAGLLREWAPGGAKGHTVARWERLSPAALSPAGQEDGAWPAGRGGHAMVRVGRKIVLFGGWDGTREWGDLWEYELPLTAADESVGSWRCVKAEQGAGSGTGPGPRSCHQLAVDEKEGWVYLLGGRRDDDEDDDEDGVDDGQEQEEHEGRAGQQGNGAMDVDPSSAADPTSLFSAPLRLPTASPSDSSTSPRTLARVASRLERRQQRWKSDFWRYKAVGPGRGTWECLSEDTRREGGPALLFDHAMVVDSATSRLFVFGGKNQPYDPDSPPGSATDDPSVDVGSGGGASKEGRYGGMWCYDIAARSGDPRPSSYAPTPSLSPSASDRLLSRAGHALLLDPTTPGGSTLYIHSGQRNEQYLNDLWAIRLAGVPPEGADERRGRSPLSRRDEPEREEEDEDGEANLWRQGTVLDFPFASSTAASAVPANAAHAAVNHSLIDLSALPASPEASPSRAGFPSTASTSLTRQPTILQIRRLWPSSSSTADGATASEYPSPGFTQRVTLDPHTGVWTLLTGLTRASPASGAGAGTGEDNECLRGVWRRVPGSKRGPLGWEKIDVETHAAAGAGGRYGVEAGAEEAGPMGRYAAQVVYDPLRKEHYVFGGHPDSKEPVNYRLADMWRLRIVDPTPEEALRKAKFLVRKQRFTELCATAPTVLALQYLQNDLADVVDHSSPAESSSFRACMSSLLAAPARMNVEVALDGSGELPPRSPSSSASSSSEHNSGSDMPDAELYAQRHALWEELVRFFPREERQPDARLEDTSRLLRVWESSGRRL